MTCQTCGARRHHAGTVRRCRAERAQARPRQGRRTVDRHARSAREAPFDRTRLAELLRSKPACEGERCERRGAPVPQQVLRLVGRSQRRESPGRGPTGPAPGCRSLVPVLLLEAVARVEVDIPAGAGWPAASFDHHRHHRHHCDYAENPQPEHGRPLPRPVDKMRDGPLECPPAEGSRLPPGLSGRVRSFAPRRAAPHLWPLGERALFFEAQQPDEICRRRSIYHVFFPR